ncbi:YqaJ viral recombinase family protein [Sneathia sanguinegens]|uniref:YqaJ viral recombinase family protein n=1 Tax=Sneathia sanguinegens TaxID=40543 RepID=UPI0025901C26|nr:YqaJ viral recombinase family protein [Sneathia sanguinegens]MDU4652804.1 YqaJ viral recombinase family protein [Sneathia sanguinegens]
MNTITKNRRLYIGGSDVPILTGYSKFKNYETLLHEYITGEFNFESSEYTKYGNLMEPVIRDYINKELKLNAKPAYRIKKDKKIRCNTDGYDRDKKVIIEIKTNNGKHSNTFDYELQMQLYMWAFNVTECYLVQYERPDDFYSGVLFDVNNKKKYFNLEFNPEKIKIKKIKRSKPLVHSILQKIELFWKEVDKKCMKIEKNTII